MTPKTLALASALAALGTAPALAESITINSFGGAYEEAHRACVINPFTKATGAEVQIVTAYSADAFAQLRAQKAAPQMDVIHFSGGQEVVAAAEGLLAPLDPAKMTHLADLYDIAKPNIAGGEGPAYSIAPVGMLVNTDIVKTPPAAWADLLGENPPMPLVLTDISNGYGMLGFLMLNEVAGGSMEDIQPGLDAVKGLLDKGAIVVSKSPEIQQEFAQNGAAVAPYAADYGWTLKEAGLPVEFVRSSEGVPASFITASLVAGRPNTDLATQFIDMEISPEAEACMTEALRYTPTNRKVELTPEVAADTVYGEEAVAGLKRFDPTVIEANRSAWVDAWNKTIAR